MPYNDLRKGRHSESGRAYFVTLATEQRIAWFEKLEIARILIAQMKRLHDERVVESLAWVVMPDHVHWLLTLGDVATLAQAMNALKGRSARYINARIGRTGRFWQLGYHDRALRAEEDIRGIARYIVANPLRAGIVRRLRDYPHWDAVWL